MHGNKLEQLQVGRLNLQKVSMNDTAFAVELFSKPELVAHRPDPDPENSETIRKNLVHAIEHWQTNGFGRWLLSMNDVPVGFGGLTLKRGFVLGQGNCHRICADSIATCISRIGCHKNYRAGSQKQRILSGGIKTLRFLLRANR